MSIEESVKIEIALRAHLREAKMHLRREHSAKTCMEPDCIVCIFLKGTK